MSLFQNNVSMSGLLNITNTSDATTSLDGALRVAGGLSVQKNAVVGGKLYVKDSIVGQFESVYLDVSAANGTIYIGSLNPTVNKSVKIGSYGVNATTTTIYVGNSNDTVYINAPISIAGSDEPTTMNKLKCTEINVIGTNDYNHENPSIKTDGGVLIKKSLKVEQSIYATGDSSFNNLVTSNATMNGSLNLFGDASFNSSARFANNVTMNGSLYINSNHTVNGNLLVRQLANIDGSLNVKALSTLSEFSSNGFLRVANNASINGSLSVVGDSIFTGTMRSNNTFIANVDANFNNNIRVSNIVITNDASINNILRTKSDATVGGSLVVLSDISGNGKMNIGSDVRIDGS
jgi:cytoskeletal protein CcmA (bactofilin family)